MPTSRCRAGQCRRVEPACRLRAPLWALAFPCMISFEPEVMAPILFPGLFLTHTFLEDLSRYLMPTVIQPFFPLSHFG